MIDVLSRYRSTMGSTSIFPGGMLSEAELDRRTDAHRKMDKRKYKRDQDGYGTEAKERAGEAD